MVFFSAAIVMGYRKIFAKQDNLIKGNWTVKANKHNLSLITNRFIKKKKKPKETISISFNFMQIMLRMFFFGWNTQEEDKKVIYFLTIQKLVD